MATNKLNKSDVKSVSGGKSDGGTGNKSDTINKARQIAKQELKKESLTKAVGTGPITVQVSGGASGEARPSHQPGKQVGASLNQDPPICTTAKGLG